MEPHDAAKDGQNVRVESEGSDDNSAVRDGNAAEPAVDGAAESGVDGAAEPAVDGAAESGVDGVTESGVDGVTESGVDGAAESGVGESAERAEEEKRLTRDKICRPRRRERKRRKLMSSLMAYATSDDEAEGDADGGDDGQSASSSSSASSEDESEKLPQQGKTNGNRQEAVGLSSDVWGPPSNARLWGTSPLSAAPVTKAEGAEGVLGLDFQGMQGMPHQRSREWRELRKAVEGASAVRTVSAQQLTDADWQLNLQVEGGADAATAESRKRFVTAGKATEACRTQKRKHQIGWLAAEAAKMEAEVLERKGKCIALKHDSSTKYGW